MASSDAAPDTIVPVKVPEPADHAPPTLAQPASGPVAEMSGALEVGQTTDTAAPAPAAPIVDSSAPNGDAAPPAPATESAPDPAPQTSEAKEPAPQTSDESVLHENDDTVVTETAAEPVAESSTVDAAPEANGTPSQKKGGNKRKSSGVVPEHKGKKLNKKKSMAKITHLDAQPGDIFFARLKSYPPWPSVICDEEMLPTSLLSTRPVTTKKADGTYNEAYADGGKKVQDRTFPIMFLHTNEFAWIPNTDLGDLDPENCKNVGEKGKAKSLVEAYKEAGEAHDLQYYKDMLLEHARAMEEDEANKEAERVEKAEKATKKKRKSDVKVQDDDVEMDGADDTAEVKKSSKKRKKVAESDDEESEKPVKTPKTTKLKLTTNKTPATSEKKSEKKPAKAKSEKRKSKAAVEDEEMPDVPEAEPEPPMDPEEARKAREREVLFLRHKLQKGFLARDQAPHEDDMPQMSQFIKKLENYEDLEVAIIRTTKINKVLKALVKLNTIPKDEEFNFRKRSVDLLGKWNKILGAEPQDDKKDSPATNGIHDDEKPVDEDATPVDKPAETVDPKPAPAVEQPASAMEEPTSVTSTLPEHPKTEEPPAPASEPVALDKAPESAQGAAEATEVVKSTE